MKRQTAIAIAAAVLAAVLASSATAQQPCTRNGQTYEDGTRIGDLKCDDGQWMVVQ